MQRHGRARLLIRMAAILVVGLGVGIATSLLQPELRAPWLSLANAASPWLTPMFFLGAFRRRPWGAALVGATTGLLELLGFFAIAAVRGDASAHSLVLFWVACALLGGPIFGLAGWLWWRGPRVLSAFGGALLPAAFFAEAAVIYGWRLHYLPSAILFVAVGVGVLLLLGLRGWQHGRIALWLLVAFPAGVVAELLVGMAYSQAF
jgi:hypothetical protein